MYHVACIPSNNEILREPTKMLHGRTWLPLIELLEKLPLWQQLLNDISSYFRDLSWPRTTGVLRRFQWPILCGVKAPQEKCRRSASEVYSSNIKKKKRCSVRTRAPQSAPWDFLMKWERDGWFQENLRSWPPSQHDHTSAELGMFCSCTVFNSVH